MQNFTFGRKGLNWFLFAFILFVGSSSSYGQEDCPEVGDFPATQEFCYLETIDDLDTNGNPVFQTNQEGDTQPIPGDELLEETTYFIGGEDCAPENRLPLEVDVNSALRPVNLITDSRTQGFEFTTCASEDFDSEDLASLFEADANYEIEVYDSEFGETPYNGVLAPGGSYFVGQVSTGNDCPSLRTAVGFNPNEIEGPTAEAAQTFCEGATVADLNVEGTYDDTQAIRWYRSQTANSPLSEDTQLINGVTYFAAQVVNERGSITPPCETPSGERTPVEVILEDFDAGEDASQNICNADLQTRLDDGESPTAVFLSLVDGRNLPNNVTFNPSINSLVNDYNNNPFQTFTTNATFTTAEGCEDDIEISVTVLENPDAGENGTVTLSSTDAQIELIDFLNGSPDTGGTWSPGDGTFDPSTDTPGDFTYTVDNGTCSDSAIVTVIVQDCDITAGADSLGNIVCRDDIINLPASQADIRGYFIERLSIGANRNGTFTNIADITARVNAGEEGPFNTTYTVGAGTSCEDSAELSASIVDATPANAGTFDDLTSTCSNQDPIDLTLLDNNDPNATSGGTFSGQGVTNNQFDPAIGAGTYTITYSVDETTPCTTGDDATTFDITVTTGASAGADSLGNIVCRDDIINLPASQADIRGYFIERLSIGANRNGTFTNIADITARVNAGEEGPFNTTYTVGAGTSCEDSAELSASIVDATPANAGTFDDLTSTCSNQDPIDLTLLDNNDPNATSGGTFSGQGVTNNQFDPAIGAGTYTITYSVDETTPCTTGDDATTFDITVTTGASAGADSLGNIVCRDDIINLPASQADIRGYFIERLSIGANRNGTFTNIADITARVNAGEEGPFNTTYTVGAGTSCEDSAELSASIVDATPANAGTFDDLTSTCSNQDPIDLILLDNNDPNATSGGTFSGQGVTNNQFDPAIGAGTYTITYSVDETTPCTTGDDATTFDITVTTGASAGADSLGNIVCRDDIINLPASQADIRGYFIERLSIGANRNGTFTNIADITARVNAGEEGPFNTTYTVGAGTSCEDSAELSASIVDATPANAGTFDDLTSTCSNQDPIDLTLLDNNDPNATSGGTFSGQGVTNNQFDPAIGAGTYTITYSVDETTPCTTGDDATTFDITVTTGASAGADSLGNIVCRDDIINLPASQADIRGYFIERLSIGANRNGTFTNIADITARVNAGEEGPFNTTYTVGAGTSCEDSAELSASIVDATPANAGTFDDLTSTCSNQDPIDLTLLDNNDPNATSGGTFSGQGVTNNQFDPAIGAGTYTITYSVDETTPCTTGDDATTFDITVEDTPTNTSISRTLCVTDARDLISNSAAGLGYLQGLLEESGVEDFDVTNFSGEAFTEAFRLAQFIDTPTADSETFNFEYTDPSNSLCDNGVITIDITINDLQDAEAGEIEDQTVCVSSGMIDLTSFFTDETVPGGTFSGTGVEDNMFDSSIGTNEDGYEITYTVDDSADCVTEGTSASTTFVISIDDSVNAGSDNSANICRAEINDLFPDTPPVRSFYLDLLDEGVSREGVFEPTIQELVDAYNSNSDQEDFTTVYTITNGTCSDSVELTITVFDSLPAEIGDINDPDPICRNAEDVDLFSFLPEDVNPNGTFEGYEDGIFSPEMMGVGEFEITYSLTDDSPCTEGTASATFTITVLESAFAGMDMDLNVCMSDGVQNLFDSLSVDADDNGEFSLDGDVIADGMLDPANLEAGEYSVIYTVEAINDCGDDTAEFTITVQETPDAPIVDGNPFNFCATDNPTGADLSANGTDLTFYSDEALTTMVASEDALVMGTYYVTQRVEEDGCESEASEVTVNINDADTPTTTETNPTFCEFDDATIADLTDDINESGTITWYDSEDGNNALDSGSSLQDGVTYYATLFSNDTGCESSVRLAVTVTIDDDCPLMIPEGFSPNGDGLNDRFEIRNIRDKYPNFTMEIRNRFGDMVYKGNANTSDWDGFSTEGSFGSDVLPVGAYFYYLRYNDGSTEPVRGTVYLSR